MFGGGVYFVTGFNQIVFVLVCSVFNTCVSLFVLISGYFGIKTTLHKGVKLWLQVWMCSVISFLIPGIMSGNFSYLIQSGIIKVLFPITQEKYWYATSYMLIFVLANYINDASQKLSKEKFEKFLLIWWIVFSVIPTFTFHHMLEDSGKGPANVFLMYFIGRYIRIYKDDDNNFKKYALIAFISLLLGFIGNMSATYLYTTYLGGSRAVCPFDSDYSVFIVIASIAIFMCFKSMTIKSKLINSFAKHVFTIYLLESAFRSILAFDISKYQNSYYLPLVIAVLVITTMIGCSIIAVPINIISKPISLAICNLIEFIKCKVNYFKS